MLRRFTALVTSVLLLNLLWVGSGTPCAMASMPHAATHAINLATPTAPHHAPMSPAAPPCGGSHGSPDCLTMSACAVPAATLTPAVVASLALPTRAALPVLRALAPPSFTRTPAPPPPRA